MGAILITTLHVCVCVREREREAGTEREREKERGVTRKVKESLPAYQCTPTFTDNYIPEGQGLHCEYKGHHCPSLMGQILI